MDTTTKHEKLLDQFIAKSDELVKWLTDHGATCMIGTDKRARLVASCFYIALEHHQAIVSLAAQRLWPSASALVRSMIVAYVRGVWLFHHASPAEVDNFDKKGRLKKDVDDMVTAIENHTGKKETVLSVTKGKLWGAMCGYVHTEMEQLSRCLRGKNIRPIFTPREIIDMLTYANWCGSSVGYAMKSVFGSTTDVEKFEETQLEYVGYFEALVQSLISESGANSEVTD